MAETYMRNIGLFDLDNSLAGYAIRLAECMERMASPDEPRFAMSQLHGPNALPHLKERERLIKREPGWWANLPPIVAGLKVYRLSIDLGFDNRICSRGPESNAAAWGEKLLWCQTHLPKDPPPSVTITREKDHVYGKFLYDDWPPYASAWLRNRPRGWVIMPTTDENRGFEHPRVLKYDGSGASLLRVGGLLSVLATREPGKESA